MTAIESQHNARKMRYKNHSRQTLSCTDFEEGRDTDTEVVAGPSTTASDNQVRVILLSNQKQTRQQRTGPA